jgi:hypothetical protein
MNLTRIGMTLVFGALCAGAPMASAELVTGLTVTNTLVTFDSATPGAVSAPVAITGLSAGEFLVAIDRRPATGQLYGLGSASHLYVINTVTGSATQVGSSGAFTLNGTAFGFDFNPTVDRIRVTSTTTQNLRLNPNDGTLAATDSALAYATGDANFGATPRIVGSAYTNNFSAATTTTLYDIDSNLDILATQIPPNNGVLNTVGALGFNTSDLVGFDISGLTGTAFASLTAPGAPSSSLFTVNLATGAGTLVGTIGASGALLDIAVTTAVPEPSITISTSLGLAVLAFALRRRRSSVRRSELISPLSC